MLLSATMFEVLVKGRVAHPVEELDDETLKAIAESAVPSPHDELNQMLKDWTP